MKTAAKITTALTLSAALLGGGVAPATAAPTLATAATSTSVTPESASTSVVPLLGLAAGSYVWWCNWQGYFCKKAKRIQNWGSFESICSDLWCTEFYYSKHHPKPYQIKKISAVRYY